MAGCYECNHCGKCTMRQFPVGEIVLVCKECGRIVAPGEPAEKCPKCGSKQFTFEEIAHSAQGE